MRIGLNIGLPNTQQKPPAALDYIRALGELGFDEVMVRAPADPATFDLLATELIPIVEKYLSLGAEEEECTSTETIQKKQRN